MSGWNFWRLAARKRMRGKSANKSGLLMCFRVRKCLLVWRLQFWHCEGRAGIIGAGRSGLLHFDSTSLSLAAEAIAFAHWVTAEEFADGHGALAGGLDDLR